MVIAPGKKGEAPLVDWGAPVGLLEEPNSDYIGISAGKLKSVYPGGSHPRKISATPRDSTAGQRQSGESEAQKESGGGGVRDRGWLFHKLISKRCGRALKARAIIHHRSEQGNGLIKIPG
jgi:hypothetical protein